MDLLPPPGPPPHRPGRPGGPGRGRRVQTPYSQQNRWSFTHAAAWHHHLPESRIVLYPSYMVTLYDPKYTSLEANHILPVSKHNLSDISPGDIKTFKAEVEGALNAWRDDKDGQLSSGVDWRSVAQVAVERNGDRLSEMRELLGNVSSSTNVTAAISTARLIAFALVMPYIDHPTVLSSNATDDSRAKSLHSATQQCSFAFTGHLDTLPLQLTPQERRLKGAIEGVLARICSFATATLEESLGLLEDAQDSLGDIDYATGINALQAWQDNLLELMGWLGWAMWQRCPRACDWDVRLYLLS